MCNKRAFAIPIVFIVILLITLAIGSFISYYSSNLSKEFLKDLAMSRGYWGCFGAKELSSEVGYRYYSSDLTKENYDINISKNGNIYSWKLNELNSGIKDSELWHRSLRVDINKKILSYKRE